MSIVFLIGRVLFSLLFIMRGVCHFTSASILHAESMGVLWPAFFVPLAGIIALLGGLSIALGYYGRVGAWLLVVFLLPITWIMHPFWDLEDFYPRIIEQLCFWKNLSLLGAALMIAYFGTGPFSLNIKQRDVRMKPSKRKH